MASFGSQLRPLLLYGIPANHIDPLAHLLISDLSNAACCPALLPIVLRHGNCKAIRQTDYYLRFRTQDANNAAPFETGASYALCNLLTLLVFRDGSLSASYSLTHLLSATYQNASLEWDMHLGTPIGNAPQSAGRSNVSRLHLKRAS